MRLSYGRHSEICDSLVEVDDSSLRRGKLRFIYSNDASVMRQDFFVKIKMATINFDPEEYSAVTAEKHDWDKLTRWIAKTRRKVSLKIKQRMRQRRRA